MEGWRQGSSGCFRAVCRAPSSRTWSMREAIAQQGFTQCLHAPGVRERSVAESCVPMVRSQVRTIGTHPPMRTSTRFAPTNANQAARLSKDMVTRRWFPLWFPRFCSVFHWQPDQLPNKPMEEAVHSQIQQHSSGSLYS